MKCSWGHAWIKDGGGPPHKKQIIVEVHTANKTHEAWAYLTPYQAKKIAAQLLKLANKK